MKEEIFIALALAGGLYLFAKTNDAAAAAALPSPNSGGVNGTGIGVSPASNNIVVEGNLGSVGYQVSSNSLTAFL